MDIDQLIKQAEELKSIPYDSPKVDLWKKRTKEFVIKYYGEEYVAFLRKSWSWGSVLIGGHGQTMHIKAMSRVIEFLDSLKKEPLLANDIRQYMIKPEIENKNLVPHKPNIGNVTISGGTVIFGDGNKITQVAVKELVDALSEEIKEKVSEGEEKKNILHSLKEITTNETFASVAGTVIGEILRRVVRP